METKRFPLDEVLSIVPGNLVAVRHIDAVYDILNWMTNDELFTHQLPRAANECRPWLLEWFPELAEAVAMVPELKNAIEGKLREELPAVCAAWVKSVLERTQCKPFYDVPRIPREDHQVKNPIAEAVEMFGADKVAVAVLSDNARSER